MTIKRSKSWWMSKVIHEGDTPVGAGRLVLETKAKRLVPIEAVSTEEARLAFGKFVKLMRRRRSFSVEQLAEKAQLDVSEVLIIEDDLHYVPGPRTVFQLAQFFNVPQQGLMQLAGLTTARDAVLNQEAVRFAARSEPVSKLTKEESAALEAFVSILSDFRPANPRK